MNDFLIKSAVCAFVLLAAYHLFLEREKMHRFNRFYLLGSVIFSFVMPFITIEIITEVQAPIASGIAMPAPGPALTAVEEKTNYILFILWSLYMIGAALFSLRFMNNLLEMIRKEKSAQIVFYKNAKLALVAQKTLPHTFLNTIFINKADYENRNIEDELYLHELTHASQKHTLDILFIEIVKIVFWFNPLFILYKKAIQLNHEFIADEKVIAINENITHYQTILLSKANNPIISLASNLNYSLTKKRLVMMGRYTSKSTAFLKKMLLLPILAALLFCMCTKETEKQKTSEAASSELAEIDKNRDLYFAGVMVHLIDKDLNITLHKPYEQLTLAQKRKYMIYFPMPQQKKIPTQEELEDFKDAAKYELSLNDKSAPNNILNQYRPKDIAYYETLAVAQKDRSKRYPQPYHASVYTHDYFESNFLNKNRKFGGREYRMTFDNKAWAKVDSILNAGKNKKPAISNEGKSRAYSPDESGVYHSVEENPEPQEGLAAFLSNIGREFKIPEGYNGKGYIFIRCIVETNGTLSNIHILRDELGIGDEAVRVLKNTQWIPGKVHNMPVRSAFVIPIKIAEKNNNVKSIP